MKKYCPDLYQNLFVQKVDENRVQLGHCCVSKLSEPTDSINFHHEFLQENRNHLLNTGNLPAACSHCERAESIGLSSRRTHSMKADWHPVEFKLRNLDYNCDNICNLKCIMCSSYYSSAWIEDDLALGKRIEPRIKPTKHNDLIYTIDANSIHNLYFNGGEPLMTRDHINVLTHIVNTGNPAQVAVNYSSNATFTISQEMMDLWNKFRKVNIGFSVDAIGEVYEFIRFPAKWQSVSKNLLAAKSLANSKFTHSIQVTIGLHNILYFDELYHWAIDNGFKINIQGDTLGTNQLSLLNFPRNHVDYLKDYINNLKDSEAKATLLGISNHITGGNTRWISFLDSLDKIRGTDWRRTIRRLSRLISDTNSN
jgi:organic radical activating enzyme